MVALWLSSTNTMTLKEIIEARSKQLNIPVTPQDTTVTFKPDDHQWQKCKEYVDQLEPVPAKVVDEFMTIQNTKGKWGKYEINHMVSVFKDQNHYQFTVAVFRYTKPDGIEVRFPIDFVAYEKNGVVTKAWYAATNGKKNCIYLRMLVGDLKY